MKKQGNLSEFKVDALLPGYLLKQSCNLAPSVWRRELSTWDGNHFSFFIHRAVKVNCDAKATGITHMGTPIVCCEVNFIGTGQMLHYHRFEIRPSTNHILLDRVSDWDLELQLCFFPHVYDGCRDKCWDFKNCTTPGLVSPAWGDPAWK